VFCISALKDIFAGLMLDNILHFQLRDFQVFSNVVDAFGCAVERILQDEDTSGQKWKVEGSANFNALVRICIRHVKSFCVRYLYGSNNLALSESKFDQRPMEAKDKNSQKWAKLRPKVKSYMSSLVKVCFIVCLEFFKT